MADGPVLFRVEDGVGVITLNRPERLNAVTWDVARELVELLRSLRTRDEVRTLVLTGAGRAFCSGGDAEWLSGSAERGMPGLSEAPLERYQRKTPAGPIAELVRMIVEVEKPVIAALHGPVMGVGLAFALACDRRFADPSTRMCAAMVRLGFAPDCGITWLLAHVARLPTALMLATTGRKDLDAALAYARELAQGPSVAIDLARRFVWKSLRATLDEMLDYEAVASTMSAHTADAREGTRAFLEKRKPKFEGR
jgi:2-(1,2-epoxy-1,2-dihydrophenyl)acetyl-CoA isomerase